jgi:hypothetical protein
MARVTKPTSWWCPTCGEGLNDVKWPLRCTDCDVWFCGRECIDDPKGHPCKQAG